MIPGLAQQSQPLQLCNLRVLAASCGQFWPLRQIPSLSYTPQSALHSSGIGSDPSDPARQLDGAEVSESTQEAICSPAGIQLTARQLKPHQPAEALHRRLRLSTISAAARRACSTSAWHEASEKRAVVLTHQTPSSVSYCNWQRSRVPDNPGGARGFAASATSHAIEEHAAEEPHELVLPIQAIHLGSKINLEEVASELGYMQRELGRDHCIFWRTDLADDTQILDVSREKVELPRYAVVVWRFGSVVFFNPEPSSMEQWVRLLSKHTQNLQRHPLEEGVTLVVRPSLDSWYVQEPDRMVVQVLDVGNTRIISRILAQSVALDFHTRKVDDALQSINEILTSLAVKGKSHKMTNQRELFKFIAENNLLYTEVISRLGLLDMSETAWDTERYFELWSSLHQDFEIDKRFRALQAKLLPIQENAKFLLQVRHDQKSERQELIIIWLIAIEIVLMATQVVLEFGI